MAISFNQIPADIRVPLVYIEFDNSQAVVGTPAMPYKVLLLGQKLDTGSATTGDPIQIFGADQAVGAFGQGSMLNAQFQAFKAANRYTETWAIPLADDDTAAAAAGSIEVSGTASAAGTIALYVAGNRVRIGVDASDSASAIATAVAAAINDDDTLPVTAEVDGQSADMVNVTARHAGLAGNDIDMRHSYYTGEQLPADVKLTINPMVGGTANPDISDAIAAMGDEWYSLIVMPYTDAANLTALETELTDRWGPTRQIDGIAFAAKPGTQNDLATFGGGENSPHITCMGMGDVPEPPWVWASVNAAVAASSLSIDPARPMQTLDLPGLKPPAMKDRFARPERNLLLHDGISTFTVNAGGTVQIEGQITTYQVNDYGSPDPSFLYVNTPATLSYIRYATRTRITQKFPRHKLADDGTKFKPGQAIVTPKVLQAELVALMRELEGDGFVENVDAYKDSLIVERDANNRNRANVLSHPDLVNQFRIYAEQTQFIV